MKTQGFSILIFLSLPLAGMHAFAQSTPYDHVDMGTFPIGYCDTIIYDDQIDYNQYGYQGPAPVFVQMWFPLTSKPAGDFMTIAEFRHRNVPQALSAVYNVLDKHMDESFMRDGLSHDLLSDEPIDYGALKLVDVLNKVKMMPTKTSRSQLLPLAGAPAIVYHHGSQGMMDENLLMAEYFASRGYLFVSANYHLPYPTAPYGLLPYALEQENLHNQSTAKAVIDFVKTLTGTGPPFFIGHSWGAQEGWCFLHDTAFAKAFVSMETTIEFKRDTLEISEKWPQVFEALKVNRHRFSTPILAFAAHEPATNFDFFRESGGAAMVMASYKEPFAHNSYTSFYTMRYFLHEALPQPDEEIVLSQIIGYRHHLELIHAFLEGARSGQTLDKRPFTNFCFHE